MLYCDRDANDDKKIRKHSTRRKEIGDKILSDLEKGGVFRDSCTLSWVLELVYYLVFRLRSPPFRHILYTHHSTLAWSAAALT
ncbi:MAG: hypothetical protein Greene041614_1220 [Parcubacteria group bacterium Greene0416_14]|nr:MAG: hypothetical protein Greene041614_1220 [Parcubacteria group bacterium Greene0416_14]